MDILHTLITFIPKLIIPSIMLIIGCMIIQNLSGIITSIGYILVLIAVIKIYHIFSTIAGKN